MPELYLIIVALLFLLAISDLIVGVSNDAVNFLNSAIGSKVASRKAIMIVASLGIFVGTTFSSGMMEVARKGIFNPEYFFFAEIMVVFLAVMLTDILLLDLFNTFGMPTSTTVSIVFEILGAAVAVATLKILANGDSLATLSNYINSSSAIAIISGIFLSVGVAFLVGALVMFFSRLLFSFHFEKRMQWVGALWSGIALALLSFFLVIKGAKGASFMSKEVITWVSNNALLLLAVSVIFWTIVMQVLLSVFKQNILRIVVLFGTFSLAMAFAGNDLVNFIGVPIAGFESYLAWSGSGIEAEAFGMESLTKKVQTNTFLLLMAGVIMIVTLWFSKKARSVTETEVNLGRQSDGTERFTPNAISKSIVRYSRVIGDGVSAMMPKSWVQKINENFKPAKYKAENHKKHDPPAFDLVRASVNLTAASVLIAFATSLKLPLSTTYVSFMVAMGTSLADKAWGRDSAVYRISGVLSVIGGWFLTAIIAFSAAGFFAFLIFKFGIVAIGLLVLLVIFSLYKTYSHHKEEFKEAERMKSLEKEISSINGMLLVEETSKHVANLLNNIANTYKDTVYGLLDEDLVKLKKVKKDLKAFKKENKYFKRQLFSSIKRVEEDHAEISRLYLLVYDLQQDIVQSTRLIVQECDEYVANSLPPFNEYQRESLLNFMQQLENYIFEITTKLRTKEFEDISHLLQRKTTLFAELENLINKQITGIKSELFGLRNSMLFFSLQLETKDLIAVTANFAELFSQMYSNSTSDNKTVVSKIP